MAYQIRKQLSPVFPDYVRFEIVDQYSKCQVQNRTFLGFHFYENCLRKILSVI